ncbi:hypothetical protein ACTFDJ_07185, partial [Campylobacter jejuni]
EVMYKGINEENDETEKIISQNKRHYRNIENLITNNKSQDYSNKFIGRLATTIIMEDGLYMG